MCSLGLAREVAAQDEPEEVEAGTSGVDVELGATLQPRVGYGLTSGGGDEEEDRFGFGLRRARLRMTATFESQFGIEYSIDAAGGNLVGYDLYGFYEPNEALRFRFGFLPGAQPRAFTPTSSTRIDAVDRAAIAELWGDGTLGSRGRDFGIDVRYEEGPATVELFVHNGDGAFGTGNFRPSASDGGIAGDGGFLNAVSVAARVEPEGVPGLEVGGFAGFNSARNTNTFISNEASFGRRYVSYSGHLYWGADPGSQPVRLKADVIGIRYEEVEAISYDEQQTLGYALLGAVRPFRAAEGFARFERFRPDADEPADGFVTVGASFSPSALRGRDYRNERVTLAYSNRLPAADGLPRLHLVVLQAQFVF